jgi:hypothetical protein
MSRKTRAAASAIVSTSTPEPQRAKRKSAVLEPPLDAERAEYVSVLWNKRTGVYVVEPMAKHPTGASAIFGPPVTISAEQFESDATSAVLSNLAKYHHQVFRAELAPKKRLPQGERSFLKTHLSVSVTRYASGDIWIYPMQHTSGGYTGIGEKIVVPAADVKKKLVDGLRQAFSKSS